MVHFLAVVCPPITVSHGKPKYTPSAVYGRYHTYTYATIECDKNYIPTEFRSLYRSYCDPWGSWTKTLSCQGHKIVVILLARLESAYSLIWGAHEIWGQKTIWYNGLGA